MSYITGETITQTNYSRSRSGSPSHAPLACRRCHARKRKCDRAFPACRTCIEAEIICEYETRADDRLRRQIGRLIAANEELQQRLREIETQRDMTPRRSTSISGDISVVCTAGEQAPSSRVGGSGDDIFLRSLLSSSTYVQSSVQDSIMKSHRAHIPTFERAEAYALSYLAELKMVRHNTDKEQIMEDMRLVYGLDGLDAVHLAQSRFRCFAVIYVEAVSRPPDDGVSEHSMSKVLEACRSLALAELDNVLAQRDLNAVQSLSFLCLFNLHQPGGPPLWQLVAVAIRTAIALGIHRRDELYLPTVRSTFTSDETLRVHNLRRKNIFWSLYSWDRMIMFTQSHPPNIRDCDVDVDLPIYSDPHLRGPAAVATSQILSFCTHQRRLSGEIQEALYSVSSKPLGPLSDREARVYGLVKRVQDWYTNHPVKGPFVPRSDATVARQSLDEVLYHQMLIALYRPSPLIPYTSSDFVSRLLDSAIISIDNYRHYWPRKQVYITWIHLYYIYTACSALVYCYCEHISRSDLVAIPPDEIGKRIEQCRDLLERFAPSWPDSRRYQVMFDVLVKSYDDARESIVDSQPPEVDQARSSDFQASRWLNAFVNSTMGREGDSSSHMASTTSFNLTTPIIPPSGAVEIPGFQWGTMDTGPVADQELDSFNLFPSALDTFFTDINDAASPSTVMRGFW